MHRRQKRTNPALPIAIAAVVGAIFAVSFLTNGPAAVLWPLQVPAILWVVEHGTTIGAVIVGWIVGALALVGAWVVVVKVGRALHARRRLVAKHYYDRVTGLTYTIRDGSLADRVEQIQRTRETIQKVRRFRAQRHARV